MATPKQAHALVNHYIKQYENKYSVKPTVNRYSARWGFDSMLMDLSLDEVKALIEYYVNDTIGYNHHSLEWFFYNYERLIESKKLSEEEAERLSVIREQSRKRIEEWRNRIGKS